MARHFLKNPRGNNKKYLFKKQPVVSKKSLFFFKKKKKKYCEQNGDIHFFFFTNLFWFSILHLKKHNENIKRRINLFLYSQNDFIQNLLKPSWEENSSSINEISSDKDNSGKSFPSSFFSRFLFLSFLKLYKRTITFLDILPVGKYDDS